MSVSTSYIPPNRDYNAICMVVYKLLQLPRHITPTSRVLSRRALFCWVVVMRYTASANSQAAGEIKAELASVSDEDVAVARNDVVDDIVEDKDTFAHVAGVESDDDRDTEVDDARTRTMG
jgi:hypothetical protein